MVGHFVRHEQRQPAAGVSSEVEPIDPVEGAAFELRQVTAHGRREVEFALDGSQRGQGCGQGLAERADLEQGAVVDRCAGLAVGDAVMGDRRPRRPDESNRHAGDLLRLHQRGDDGVEYLANLLVRYLALRLRHANGSP